MTKPKKSVDGFTQRNRKTIGDFNQVKPLGGSDKSSNSSTSVNKTLGASESNVDIHTKIEGTRPESSEVQHTVSTRKAKRKAKKLAKKQKRASQPKFWRFTKRLLVIGALSVVLLGGVFALNSWLALQSIIDRGGDGAVALQDNVDPSQLNGEGDGRVNILLLGIGGEKHQAGNLADSIIVASIDPFAKEMGMLSLPRDLYVEIPGFGNDKINAAHAYGEDYNHPGGGVALMEETVESILDIPIHYYIRVDFDGFTQAVDTVGGIDIVLDEQVYDPNFDWQFGPNALNLPAGKNHLDGQTALLLSRARGASGIGLGVSRGDFGRSDRQRDILLGVKEKVLSVGTFANPAKVASLISTAGSHVRTNLQINELLRVYELISEIPQNKIVSYGLDNSPDNYLKSAVSSTGASIQVPKTGNFLEIQKFVRGIFEDGFIKMESPIVDVYNGSTKSNIASVTAEELRTYGYVVEKIGDAPTSSYVGNVMIDLSGGEKPFTKQLLKNRFSADVLSPNQLPKSITSTADFVIIIGNDESSQN